MYDAINALVPLAKFVWHDIKWMIAVWLVLAYVIKPAIRNCRK
jgi:hypothetical protein